MNKSKHIKEAEQNVLNQAKFWTDFLRFIDGMSYGISARLDSPQAKEQFAEGLTLLREAAWNEQQFALARCFALVGVGGKEAEKFSKERAKVLFGGGYSTIQWLDEWNRVPSYWLSSKNDEFKKELQEKLKDTNND